MECANHPTNVAVAQTTWTRVPLCRGCAQVLDSIVPDMKKMGIFGPPVPLTIWKSE
jgi:hypothetical protein